MHKTGLNNMITPCTGHVPAKVPLKIFLYEWGDSNWNKQEVSCKMCFVVLEAKLGFYHLQIHGRWNVWLWKCSVASCGDKDNRWPWGWEKERYIAGR